MKVNRRTTFTLRVRLPIKLGLSGDIILIWFKNRRAKTRNTDTDTRTTGTDKGRNLTSNIRLAKKNTCDDDDDDVCKIMPKQRNKRLRCVDRGCRTERQRQFLARRKTAIQTPLGINPEVIYCDNYNLLCPYHHKYCDTYNLLCPYHHKYCDTYNLLCPYHYKLLR
ncbi:hypothetical protein DPMN_048440 [Dreissena polymorpha]|uniref:Homeobox domain-containing protein n=1 Tax=Dreissena polymorpha TaxID=45954 RepID=A0A9D4I064_DREPO|nr:hypothetical protein DPMN_048440 [Dreissena polymorpha]